MAPPNDPTPYRPGFAVQDLALLLLLVGTFAIALLAVPSFDSALTAEQWWTQSRLYWLIPVLILLAAVVGLAVRRLLALRSGFLPRIARGLLFVAVIAGAFLLTTRVRAIELRQNWADKRAVSLAGGRLSNLARPIPCAELDSNASGVSRETCQRIDAYRETALKQTVTSLNDEKAGLSSEQMAAQLAATTPSGDEKKDPPPTDDLCQGQDQTKCAIAGLATIACLVVSEGAAWRECLGLFALIMGIGGGGGGGGGGGLSLDSQQNVGQTIAAVATGSQPATASASMADEQNPRAFDVADTIIAKLVADGRVDKAKADQLSTTLRTQKKELTGSLLNACTARLAQKWSELNAASPDWCALKKLQTEGACRSIDLPDAEFSKALGGILNADQLAAFNTASQQCGK